MFYVLIYLYLITSFSSGIICPGYRLRLRNSKSIKEFGRDGRTVVHHRKHGAVIFDLSLRSDDGSKDSSGVNEKTLTMHGA